MIGIISRPKTRSLHRAHAVRNRIAWMLVIGILAAAVISFSIGYFYTVSWTVLAEAVLRTTYRLAAAYGIAVVPSVWPIKNSLFTVLGGARIVRILKACLVTPLSSYPMWSALHPMVKVGCRCVLMLKWMCILPGNFPTVAVRPVS
jgi:hypothetical protein